MEKKQTILIVDDSPTIRSILQMILKGNGFTIKTASNGSEALMEAEKSPPDLLLLDIEMPGIDGFETCRRFRSSKTLSKIPILFLSSFDDVGKKVKAFQAGGVDYISKPVQKEELVARVETHLELKRLQEELYKKINDTERLIHILCHDVSNPLTCITGWAEMLVLDNRIEKDKQLSYRMKRILQSSHQASDIIDHVREMEKLSRQKKALQLEPVSVKEVIENALVIFENRMKEKKITFECVPDLAGLETRILAEKISFTTNVFHNLFSNTLKFSYPGSVISLFIDENEKEVHLTLKDKGIGIPGNLLENIFTPDASTSRPGTSGEDGSGFGMPLMKQYMDYYGGSIMISSKPEAEFPQQHGTEFQLTLKNGQQGYRKKKASAGNKEVKAS
ncbi:MAG: hybrid sensor histidine kinase/response regulator [Candidatus Aminicenantes bacterium]|nr:hybrid sensor histidine kinase/response regulator [Candidatus Aminicenantes bacterium]